MSRIDFKLKVSKQLFFLIRQISKIPARLTLAKRKQKAYVVAWKVHPFVAQIFRLQKTIHLQNEKKLDPRQQRQLYPDKSFHVFVSQLVEE